MPIGPKPNSMCRPALRAKTKPSSGVFSIEMAPSTAKLPKPPSVSFMFRAASNPASDILNEAAPFISTTSSTMTMAAEPAMYSECFSTVVVPKPVGVPSASTISDLTVWSLLVVLTCKMPPSVMPSVPTTPSGSRIGMSRMAPTESSMPDSEMMMPNSPSSVSASPSSDRLPSPVSWMYMPVQSGLPSGVAPIVYSQLANCGGAVEMSSSLSRLSRKPTGTW